jgi:hypothetical protein
MPEIESYLEPIQPCGCVVHRNAKGVPEIDFCRKHSPPKDQLENWSIEELTLYILENLKMREGSLGDQWQHAKNDRCTHCNAETVPAHEYRRMLVAADLQMGPDAKGLVQIFSDKGFECPNCHKKNYLHVYIIAIEESPNAVAYHAYAFPTFEYVKKFANFVGKRDFESASRLKV